MLHETSGLGQMWSPWLDGERIPEKVFLDVFRRPPDISFPFYRSTLVIGSRGSGKTTLLRAIEHFHKGVALSFKLTPVFGAIPRAFGTGRSSLHVPERYVAPMAGMAISIFALRLAEQLLMRGIAPPHRDILNCLPESHQRIPEFTDGMQIRGLLSGLSLAPPSTFDGIYGRKPLLNLLPAVADACQSNEGDLLILMDKTEQVPAPALLPLLELLDQSEGYLAVLSLRPGHGGRLFSRVTTGFPGDHFSLCQLGMLPYSTDWHRFVKEAIQAQKPALEERIPEATLLWMLTVSRDSVRHALELVASYLNAASDPDAMADQTLGHIRHDTETAAESLIRDLGMSFSDFIKRARQEARPTEFVPGRPLVAEILPSDATLKLVHTLSDDTAAAIELALRTGAASLPSGDKWIPGGDNSRFELPPYVTWRKGDSRADLVQGKERVFTSKETQAFCPSGFPGHERRPKVFIAFRMSPKGEKFRDNLRSALNDRPDLNLDTIDGHVGSGLRWPDEVRKRIRSSAIVVGDLTGPRSDVLFELGFAYGLQKHVILATEDAENRQALPEFLRQYQITDYSPGMKDIVGDIEERIKQIRKQPPERPPSGVPDRAVMLDSTRDARRAEIFEAEARRSGLRPHIISQLGEPSDQLRIAASAGLLCMFPDGGRVDDLAHFAAGAVVAKPRIGRTLKRKILVRSGSLESKTSSPVAHSLLFCPGVSRVSDDNLLPRLREYSSDYESWIAGKRGVRRVRRRR